MRGFSELARIFLVRRVPHTAETLPDVVAIAIRAHGEAPDAFEGNLREGRCCGAVRCRGADKAGAWRVPQGVRPQSSASVG